MTQNFEGNQKQRQSRVAACELTHAVHLLDARAADKEPSRRIADGAVAAAAAAATAAVGRHAPRSNDALGLGGSDEQQAEQQRRHGAAHRGLHLPNHGSEI